MSQPSTTTVAQTEEEENQLIISDCDRIADVCNSFQGDLLSLIEENDRYREWNHGLHKALKKLKAEVAQMKQQKQSDLDGDFMKKYVDLKMECSELMLTNQVLLQKVRRYEPESVGASEEGPPLSPSSSSSLASDAAIKNLLSEKALECTKLEQEIVRLHTAHREQLKQAVEQVKEQSRKRNEELQARFNQQAVSLKEDCLSIKNMIADRERAAKADGEKALLLQKENQALRQELEARKWEKPKLEPIASSAVWKQRPQSEEKIGSAVEASASNPDRDLAVLRDALQTLQITHTGNEPIADLIHLAVAGIAAHESSIKARMELLEAQKVEVDKASKELDVKTVRLNGKIASFNASVVKWNRKQQEMRDKKMKKPHDADALS